MFSHIATIIDLESYAISQPHFKIQLQSMLLLLKLHLLDILENFMAPWLIPDAHVEVVADKINIWSTAKQLENIKN